MHKDTKYNIVFLIIYDLIQHLIVVYLVEKTSKKLKLKINKNNQWNRL